LLKGKKIKFFKSGVFATNIVSLEQRFTEEWTVEQFERKTEKREFSKSKLVKPSIS
jgi:hypothetical protein